MPASWFVGLATVVFALAPALTAAEQLTFVATKDNTLLADDDTRSNGGAAFLFIGNIASGAARRSLLQFDLAGVPQGAIITSAELRVYVDKNAFRSSITDVATLYRLTESWGEGSANGGTGGGGALASPEDATWKYRFYGNPSAGIPRIEWLAPGGTFVATPSGQATLAGIGAITFQSTPGLVADVQGWVSNAGTNHGWIMLGNEDADQNARRILSRTSAAAANRPELTVVYSLATAVPTVGTAAHIAILLGLASLGMLLLRDGSHARADRRGTRL